MEGPAMSGGIISPDFPSHGKFGYRGHFLFPANGGKADFTTRQVGDLTGGTYLTVDVYNASKTPMTLMMIVKQGQAWLWCQSPEKPIQPGWNKDMTFDLTSLKTDSGKTLTDLKDIMQLSLIFQSKEAGEGYLYIDYLRLEGANPGKVAMVRPEEMATGSPVTVTGFEDGSCPLSPDTGYSGATGADAVTASDAPEGTRVADLAFDCKQPDAHASFQLEADMDLSKVTGVVYDVYNPFKQNIDASIFVNTGANWDYYESSSATLKPGWNTDVTFALKAKTFKSAASKWTNTVGISGISVTRKLGLTFYPHQIAKSSIRLDNLRFLSNDPKSVQQLVNDLFPQVPATAGGDNLLEGFEKGLTAWTAIASSKATGSTIVEGKASEGTHMLKCDFDFDDKNQQAWIGIDQDLNFKDSSAIKVDIYNPNPSPLQAEIVLKLGDTYDWTESKGIQMKPGWNRDVTFPLKAKTFKNAASNWMNHAYADPLDQVKSLYIGFVSTGALKGSAYFDNIRATGSFKAGTAAAAAQHELKGRSVLWDPLLNFAGDGWLAQTSPGSNSFAVVSEYKRFQDENIVDMKYRTVSDSQTAQFVKTQETDWSNVLGLQFDFYNPQDYAVGFTLAVQTGPNSEWQESTETTLKPGWNRAVKVDITQPIFKSLQTNWSGTDFLRTRDDIRTVIINIYPHHVGDGKLSMANLRIIERDLVSPATGSDDLGKALGLSSETQISARTLKYTLLDSFEGNISAWQPVANAVLSQSTSYATDGTHSLRIDYQSAFVAVGTNPAIEYNPPGGTMDMSPYSNVQFDVYNPGLPVEMYMAFYTGPAYNGTATGQDIQSISVTISSGWNRNLNIPLLGNQFTSATTAWKEWDTLRNASQTHQIQFVIESLSGGIPPGRQTIYLDNVRLIGAGNQQVDGIASEQIGLKFNPSDAVQFVANGTVMGTGTNQAQFNLGKVRLDVRAEGDEFSLFTGDQLSSTDDPMTLLSGAVLGNQIYGIDDRYTVQGLGMLEASGFSEYGATPESLGNTAGYLLRFKTAPISDCFLGAGLLDSRYGNNPGSNPLTAEVEADVKTYEADVQGYFRDIRLGFHGEVAQSAYDAFAGSPYDLSGNSNAYYAELDYQFGAFKIQGSRLEHGLNFFAPYSGSPYSGADQNTGQITWQMDTLPLIKDMQGWGTFWNNLLTGLNLQVQYYDYASMTDTYSNFGLRALLQNNTYRPPLFFFFWWYWYDEGQNAGDPQLPNPAISDRALVTTSNYELHYQFTPKILLTGLFRDAFTDYWETFTYSGRFSWKFWGDTWVNGDYKHVDQTGSRFGSYDNFSAGFTKYLWQNTVTLSLIYGVPSFLDYWEDDNNLQTVDMWAFSLAGKF